MNGNNPAVYDIADLGQAPYNYTSKCKYLCGCLGTLAAVAEHELLCGPKGAREPWPWELTRSSVCTETTSSSLQDDPVAVATSASLPEASSDEAAARRAEVAALRARVEALRSTVKSSSDTSSAPAADGSTLEEGCLDDGGTVSVSGRSTAEVQQDAAATAILAQSLRLQGEVARFAAATSHTASRMAERS